MAIKLNGIRMNKSQFSKNLMAGEIVKAFSASDAVSYALDSLDDPIDELVLSLALCDPKDEYCISRAKEAIFARDAVGSMSGKTALKIYVSNVCARILSGSVSAKSGADMIARARVNVGDREIHELDPFIYASSEMEDRPEDAEFFKRAIIAEAEEWLKSNPLQ